jgi:hypothetical protein
VAASGWHTAAVTMRLLVGSELKPAGGIVGAGFDEFRWPRPVRPGDELRLESEVLEVRSSKSRPNQGLIKVRTTTLNQNNDPVYREWRDRVYLREANKQRASEIKAMDHAPPGLRPVSREVSKVWTDAEENMKRSGLWF